MTKKILVFLTLVVFLPFSEGAAQKDETQTKTFDANGQALFSFNNNVTFKISASNCVGQPATVTLSHEAPNKLRNLMAPEVSGSCIKRLGSNKCPRFDWTGTPLSCSPFEVRIFYASGNPLAINPRVCVCNDLGVCDCDELATDQTELLGYFPLVPTGVPLDPGFIARTPENSTFFAATLDIPAGAQGVATLLDPLAGHTSELNPLVANGGSTVPMKVQLCRGTSSNPCLPISDAKILVSIAQIQDGFGNDTFRVVLPLLFPGQSTPPPVMDFTGSHYRFNWTVDTVPGLYNISFVFLTSNANVLTAFVRVP